MTLRLAYRPPFDFVRLLDYFRPRAIPGVEWVGESYVRSLPGSEGPLWIEVEQADGDALRLTVHDGGAEDILPAVRAVRRLFDLDADPGEISQAFASRSAAHGPPRDRCRRAGAGRGRPVRVCRTRAPRSAGHRQRGDHAHRTTRRALRDRGALRRRPTDARLSARRDTPRRRPGRHRPAPCAGASRPRTRRSGGRRNGRPLAAQRSCEDAYGARGGARHRPLDGRRHRSSCDCTTPMSFPQEISGSDERSELRSRRLSCAVAPKPGPPGVPTPRSFSGVRPLPIQRLPDTEGDTDVLRLSGHADRLAVARRHRRRRCCEWPSSRTDVPWNHRTTPSTLRGSWRWPRRNSGSTLPASA